VTGRLPRPGPTCATGASATCPGRRRGGRRMDQLLGSSMVLAAWSRRPPRAPATARARPAAVTRIPGGERPGRPAAGTSCSRTSCVS
jgi:hypothetical protein